MSRPGSAREPANRFLILRQLGAGGMGSVFEAIDQVRQTRVAVKTLREENPDALFFLKNEFRSLSDIRHPNLAHLMELVVDEGRFFVVMELIEGQDLLRYVRPQASSLALYTTVTTRPERSTSERAGEMKPTEPVSSESPSFDEERLRAAFGQLAEGLFALHEKGKIHGDVKPSNVLVTPEARVVLVDFGLTREVDDSLRMGRSALGGTRAFMAPEQATRQELTSAADWYSFGVILHVALTGELPFQGGEQLRKQLEGLRVLSAPEALPTDLSELTLALLEPEPSLRPNGIEVLARFGRGKSPALPRHMTPFLGRQPELEKLDEALNRSRLGVEKVLVVGDSGLGKTHLVREWVARVRAEYPQTLVFSGRCYERDLVPYKALDGIVDALSRYWVELDEIDQQRLTPRDAAILARVFPVLRPVFPGEVESGGELDPQELRGRAFSALRELLRRLCFERPVILFVDDLQWADADSHVLLADLLRAPEAPRACFVATLRSDAEARPDLKDLRGRWGQTEPISLGPLSASESRELASAMLGSGAAADRVERVALEAQGHPLFLQALCLQIEQGESDFSGELPLERAFGREIEALEPGARRLLELVSISGGPLSAGLARDAADLSPLAYSSSLASLAARRLVRGAPLTSGEHIEAYHDRIRETVLGHLRTDVKRQRHADLAKCLERQSANGHEGLALVRHLEGAGRMDDAAGAALRAAKGAEQALAFDHAAELYRMALRLHSGDGSPSVHVLRSLASALAAAGRASEAAATCLELSVLVPPAERLAARRLAADHLLRSGHLEEGRAILSDVLREFGTSLKSQRRSLATMVLGRWCLSVRGLDWTQNKPERVAPALLERIDAFHAVGVSLSLIDPVRGGAFEIRALRLALEAGDPERLVPILVMETGYEASVGGKGISHSRRLIEEARKVADRTGDTYGRAVVRMMDGFVDYHAGQFVKAAARLSEVEGEFQHLRGRYFEQAFCHCFGRICLRNAGRLGQLERGYESWLLLAERRSDRFTEAVLRFNLNGVWLVRDNPDEAERELNHVRWMPPQGGYHVQHWYEAQARTEIALYRGQAALFLPRFREEMEALSRSFILRMRLHRCHAQWLLGRTLLASATHGRPERRVLREVKSISARLAREEVGFATVWSLLLAAGVAAHTTGNEATVDLLKMAQATARAVGLIHCEQTASYFLSDYEGGSMALEHRQRALAWADGEGIRNPHRIFLSWGAGLGRA